MRHRPTQSYADLVASGNHIRRQRALGHCVQILPELLEWCELPRRKSIFTDPKGIQRVAMSYNPALRRYFLVSSIGVDGAAKVMHTEGLGVFDAPEPWGPWSTVDYDQYWSGGKDGSYTLEEWTYHQKFTPKFMSRDGKTMWLLYSERGAKYAFCLKKATLDPTPIHSQHLRPLSARLVCGPVT